MNAVVLLIIKVIISLSMLGECGRVERDTSFTASTDMKEINVSRNKDNWKCNGVNCPAKVTTSCSVMKTLAPILKMDYDAVIICRNIKKKIICGATVSKKTQLQEVLDLNDEGEIAKIEKDVIITLEGNRIPRCPNKN